VGTINQEERLEGDFLDGDGSSIEKLFSDHFFVVGLEEIDNPLPDALVRGILKLDVELDIPLNVEAVVGSSPFATDFPFRFALEEIKKMSFRLGDYDGEEFPVLGIAGLLDLLYKEQVIQLVPDGLN